MVRKTSSKGKTRKDKTGDVPVECLCPLCNMLDSLRHWTSEFQDAAMLIRRREILDSLLMPDSEKIVHIFKRETSLLIPQLPRDTLEPERLWKFNLNTCLRKLHSILMTYGPDALLITSWAYDGSNSYLLL